jgi:acyl-CoA synthetase (AMP-forming)/AMP-acid ligase II
MTSPTLHTTVPAAVRANCERLGALLAVVDGDIRVTYQELADRVVVATRAMIAADVQPGDRVAIWATNSLEWIVAGLATHSAGAAIVPINTRWKGSEAAYVLSASGAKVLCTSVGFLGTDTVAMLADHMSTDETITLPSLTRVVLLSGSVGPVASRLGTASVTSWADFIAGATGVSEAEALARVDAVRPSDISDVLFTSGTTGRPKGVLMNHAQTVRQFTEWCDFAGLVEGDRYLVVNPFFHMFGYKAGWLASLLRGATIYPVPVFDVPTVLRLIETERITMFPGAPTIYRSILDHPDRANYDLSSLRVAVTGAADIPVSLIDQMRAELPFHTILTGYGLTEAGTATGSKPTDDSTTIATTAGRAMNDLDIIIADGTGNEVLRGTTGELLVRGYSVMQGYLDDPAATADAIDGNGFLHTGDLATMDERGYVRIVGRLKDMFIVGGFNVYPAEVEGTLLDHPAIGQVAVIGVPDERMGEVGMAFVVAAPGQQPDPDEIVVWARERLANYKTPRFITVVDALPINAAGKVVKDDLRRLAATPTAATEKTS